MFGRLGNQFGDRESLIFTELQLMIEGASSLMRSQLAVWEARFEGVVAVSGERLWQVFYVPIGFFLLTDCAGSVIIKGGNLTITAVRHCTDTPIEL